jgi:type I site-specific restriction endonuclease
MFGLPDHHLSIVSPDLWPSALADKRPKRTLIFTVSVAQAENLAAIFNRVRPGLFSWLCAKTPDHERRKMLAQYDAGTLAGIVNVGVLKEGFDSPGIEIVVQARPTKSRCLSAQQIGRGTRPLPGLVDNLDSNEARRAAIASSSKPFLTVLDFVGNCGKHKLVTPADVLGGKLADEVVERARKKLAEMNGDSGPLTEILAKSALELEEEKKRREAADAARKAKLVARVNFTTSTVNPFDVFGLTPVRMRGWDMDKRLSEKQQAVLMKQGINPATLSYAEGRRIVTEIFRRWDNKQCSFRQARILKARGYRTDMGAKEASAVIDVIAHQEGWTKK